jgi:hypothetical protein
LNGQKFAAQQQTTNRIYAVEGKKVEAASCRLTFNDKRRGRRFYFTRPLQRGLDK